MTDFSTTTAVLTKNDEAGRYELRLGGRLASILEYRDSGDVTRLTHAETAHDMRGHGLAARVTDFALEDIRQAGRKADPVCAFVADHMSHHSDVYGDLLVQQPHAAVCDLAPRL